MFSFFWAQIADVLGQFLVKQAVAQEPSHKINPQQPQWPQLLDPGVGLLPSADVHCDFGTDWFDLKAQGGRRHPSQP